MTNLRMWTNLRQGRMQAIANKLGVSRQRVDQIAKLHTYKDNVLEAMREIEFAEMCDKEIVKKIIANTAEVFANSHNVQFAEYAHSELKRWLSINEL